MSYQLLAPPPLNTNITKDETISVPYQKYLTNINTSLAATLLPVAFTSDITAKTAAGVGLQLPVYSTVEINSMNAPDFVMVADSTLSVPKIRIGGVWKEFTLI